MGGGRPLARICGSSEAALLPQMRFGCFPMVFGFSRTVAFFLAFSFFPPVP